MTLMLLSRSSTGYPVNHPISGLTFPNSNGTAGHFWIRVGNSVFSRDFTEVDLHSADGQITGRINYRRIVKYPVSAFSPGIMGWYSFVPFMECKHAVVSVEHELDGRVIWDGRSLGFTGGRGYIEKDWGTSFPAAWIWFHSNAFRRNPATVMFSIAKIPWLGSYFMGFLCFLYTGGIFYRFTSYNGSAVTHVSHGDKTINIHVKGPEQDIHFRVIRDRQGELKAPGRGKMDRLIRENINSRVSVILKDKAGNILFEDEGLRAGLEITPEIFGMLGQHPGRAQPSWVSFHSILLPVSAFIPAISTVVPVQW